MNNILPYPRGKRVLMLTTDAIIDRRILHEGEALIEAGYEVILLAASNSGQPLHELIGRVKVHRIANDGSDPRNTAAIQMPFHALMSLRQFMRIWQHEIADGARPTASFRAWFAAYCVVMLPIAVVLRIFRAVVNRGLRLLHRVVSGHKTLPELAALEYAYYYEALFYRPDIVHVHDLPMLAVSAALKLALRVPLFYDMHESYPDQPRLTPAQKHNLLDIERRHIAAADVVVTVNDLLLDFIRNRYQLSNSSVLQNAVSAPHFDPNVHHDRFRADYPQLAGKLLVLYQGWIARERNLETAIKAMAQVVRPEVVLLIMGYGDYADELQALAVAEGVQDRVVFVPAKSQEELLFYSASADIGLIPYPTNRDINTQLVSPNKLYEFITARLPILTNRLPFVQRVVTEWGFGVVADLDEVSAFAVALNTFDTSKLPEYRERLAHDGWRFSWQEEQKKLLRLYEQLPGQDILHASSVVAAEEHAA